jgi:hypothetical protein
MSATLTPASDRASVRRIRVGRTRLGRVAAVVGGLTMAGHGLIHLMGVALFWRLGQAGATYADAQPTAGSAPGVVVGCVWLLATALFLVAGALLVRRSARWRAVAGAAVLVSVPVLLSLAAGAGAGLVVDVAVLIAVLAGSVTARSRAMALSTDRVPREARRVRKAWRLLADHPAPTEVFTPGLVTQLPEPARRWLLHAIPDGTPLWSTAQVGMTGQIKLGAWRRFTARQIITPSAGYIWAATTWLSGLPVRGFDRCSSGSGEMRWRLLGLFPVVTVVGIDVARSAAGRLASEIVLAPTGFRAASWTRGRSVDHVVGTWQIGSQEESVELHIGPAGEVRSALVSRWGNPGGEPFGRYPFGCTMHSEQAFGGVTIPATVSAGWWWGTTRYEEGEFFRATVIKVSLN